MAPTAAVRFTRVYEAHYADVLAYCARRVNRTEAEDVASEVFVVLWRRMDRFEDEAPLPWLYSVAYRAISNRRRGTQRRLRLSEQLRGLGNGEAEPAEDVVVRREQDRVVLEAISKLRPADQEVLRLAAWEESSAPLIAEVVGCSVPAAEQRLHRAKRRLAKVLSSPFESIVPAPTIKEGGRRT